jgi:hypothetical protein
MHEAYLHIDFPTTATLNSCYREVEGTGGDNAGRDGKNVKKRGGKVKKRRVGFEGIGGEEFWLKFLKCPNG